MNRIDRARRRLRLPSYAARLVFCAVSCAWAAALPSCVTTDCSFKSITFEQAPRDVVFEACREVIASHYFGTRIRVDKTTGQIETDPVEESLGVDVRHQQVYVRVVEQSDGQVTVELMATLAKLEVDPSRTPPAEWRVYASDVRVEGRLAEEISGRVLSIANDARVVADTLPDAARSR